MQQSDTDTIARLAFSDIAAQFPHLTLVENKQDQVEISITIPIQPGLSHKTWLAGDPKLIDRAQLGLNTAFLIVPKYEALLGGA